MSSFNTYYVNKVHGFGHLNMYLDEDNVVLKRVTSSAPEWNIIGTSEIIEVVPRDELLKNSCKYSIKWGIKINDTENKQIPFMNLSQY